MVDYEKVLEAVDHAQKNEKSIHDKETCIENDEKPTRLGLTSIVPLPAIKVSKPTNSTETHEKDSFRYSVCESVGLLASSNSRQEELDKILIESVPKNGNSAEIRQDPTGSDGNSAETSREKDATRWMIPTNDGNSVETHGNPVRVLDGYVFSPDNSPTWNPVENVFDLTLAKSRLDVKSVNELLGKAEGFVVETDSDAKLGVTMAMQSRKLSNSIEKSRKAIVRPHLDFNKAVKKYADEFATCLKDIEKSILQKVENYQESREKTLKKENIIDTSMDNISVEDGSSKTVSEWVFELEDISSLPLQYMKISEKAIKGAIRLGVRNIPGLRIYEKKKKQYRITK